MSAPTNIVLLPVALTIEFDPRIRLGEVLHKLGPEYKAEATKNGRVRIVPVEPVEQKVIGK